MKKVRFLLLLLIWAVAIQAQEQEVSRKQAQEQDVSGKTENKRYARTQKKVTFAIQPLQLFNNGLRYDIDVRLGDGPGWLQFGPAFYYVPENNRNSSNYYYDGRNYYRNDLMFQWREPYTELTGAGIDLNYKHFLDARRSFYFALGLSYTQFNVKYRSRDWTEYIEDGLKYLEYGEGYNKQKIDRFGFNNFFGFQIPTRSAFLFDMFWGYAVRYSLYDEDKPAFNRDMFSYGYSGFVVLVGFRIGFGVR